tara:strand:- start:135 stop:317 length:183 start_codon:yes stop_codon:yes gene_type:complete
MRLVQNNDEKILVKLSKKEWVEIGEKTNWFKEEQMERLGGVVYYDDKSIKEHEEEHEIEG